MVLANDLRLDVNMVKFSEASGVHPLAGSINWPNIYETFTTGEIRTTYAATGVYFAGVNNSVVLSDLVVYIEQNSTARVWSGNLSTILQNFNFSTTLCEGEPLCAINMAEITGSARLARVSIVNDEFRLESINVYMSYPHTTTVASVNMSITGYSTKLGDVYNSTNVPKTWKNSLVFSNTSTGDKRQDTKILKQGQIDTVFYTSYGWNGATVSRYKRKGNGVQINASMIVITVLAAVVAISAWLMQRIDGLSAFGPPLALSIAGLVEQDTASDNSPDSDKDVQLRRSSSSSRLFLTVNGKPLMTAEVALNEGLSLMNKIEMERKTTTIDVILP
ncbi:hypothetical protein K450DRAFT_246343 [Umbelopsis ramanniana AG]|uniref:Transmembrane protein n=1 Tax=Umbelopsis ramanniana AG TaxID=1314678 RepID=A0AAD5E7Z5_UMBRA|nr:uncharacterized protein K450DRAFT_246343 [Umbelopsis ramanniana AG]KAI8578559.1 hypothetical protein K450DRAFT_246343 [Umbelopsis ramanniana AG]